MVAWGKAGLIMCGAAAYILTICGDYLFVFYSQLCNILRKEAEELIFIFTDVQKLLTA